MRNLSLLAALILWGCVRNPSSPQASFEEADAPAFPRFSAQAVQIGNPTDAPYELDGTTLRALSIALNDFLPPDVDKQLCWNRPESYRYRVIRQQNVIFIRIQATPSACEGKFLMLDSSVSYAISVEGRILRRLFTGEPSWDSAAEAPDGGARPGAPGEFKDAGVPDLSSVLGATWAEPRPSDGGTPRDAGSPPTPSP